MINFKNVLSEIERITAELDKDELPAVYSYLASLQEEDDEDFIDTPYEIADTLIGLDKPKRFPEHLIKFITAMYELEIAEGSSKAMNDLGAQYYGGSRGFEQSFDKAVHYYKMAAEKGSRAAQENLGYCYYYGRNGRPDYEKAFHYFALGAFDGHLVSLYKIGDMYLNGLYVPKNEKEAYYIFKHCLEMMTPQAKERVAGPVCLRLGRMFLEGVGTEQNLKKALKYFQKAELYLYDMVSNGEAMYRKSLNEAIKGQAAAREKMAAELPESTWKFDG